MNNFLTKPWTGVCAGLIAFAAISWMFVQARARHETVSPHGLKVGKAIKHFAYR